VTTTAPRKRKQHDGPSPEDCLINDLIALMESGELPPWRRGWQGEQGRHRNLISGHCYKGSNPVLLEVGSLLRGHTLPLWCGAAEAKARGWWPRRGSKATRIVRPQLNKREQTDSEGKPVVDADGSTVVSAWVSFKPVCVFNAGDLVGHDDETAATLAAAINEAVGTTELTPPPAARLEAAEAVLEAWPVPVLWGQQRCCYVPADDQIHMPDAAAFSTREAFCATWAHEQAHSTGHKSRLDRDLTAQMGTKVYAREELVAELAAVLICYRLQIGCQLENHAAYLKAWAGMLREEGARCLFKVLSDARKAADLIAPEAPAEEA